MQDQLNLTKQTLQTATVLLKTSNYFENEFYASQLKIKSLEEEISALKEEISALKQELASYKN